MKLECRRKLSKNQSGYQVHSLLWKIYLSFFIEQFMQWHRYFQEKVELYSEFCLHYSVSNDVYKHIVSRILDKRIREVFIHIHVHHWNAISTKSIIDVSNQRLTLSGKYLLYMFLSWTLWFPSKKKRKILFFAHFDKKTEILPLLTSYTVSKAKIK